MTEKPCHSTRHCADHDWCHRCDPDFAAVMGRVNVAIQRTDPDENHWGPLYAAVAVELRRMPDEVQQPEARPARHQWSVDMYDPGAETWLAGTPRCDRNEAAEHMESVNATRSTWADGQPVRRRLVRSTTTYTVEDET